MTRRLALILSLLLTACATPSEHAQFTQLFNDRLFPPSAERINADDIFAITPEMKHYVHARVADEGRDKGPQEALFDALYKRSELQLEYDASVTRNAADTFNTRSGNCLSLAIMTAALAKEIGLTIQYHRVYVDEMWSRSGGLYFSTGHINLTLEKKIPGFQTGFDSSQAYTVDFLPPEYTGHQRSKIIQEKTVAAMFMNNHAAELLADGKVDAAYWWARAAINEDPRFLAAYNTLGVVYRRHGNAQEAYAAFNQAYELDPTNTSVIYNLAQVLDELGRHSEASVLTTKLAKLEPEQPYHFFELGKAAMEKGDYQTARDMFTKEVARDPFNHEFHFWLASADFRLGDNAEADKHLRLAMENSTTRSDRALYAAKLNRLKAYLTN